MKLTKSTLKRLIKEELGQLEEFGPDMSSSSCRLEADQCAGLPKLKELVDQLARVADEHGFSMDSGDRVAVPLAALAQAIDDYTRGN
jgi:hypothetical protein